MSKAAKVLRTTEAAGDEDFRNMEEFFKSNVFKGAALDNLHGYMFDLSHAEQSDTSHSADDQTEQDQNAQPSDLRDVQLAYKAYRKGKNETKAQYMSTLRDLLYLCEKQQADWRKFAKRDSAEHQMLLAFKPDDSTWKLRRGVGISTLAWIWLVETTHGLLTKDEHEKTKRKMRIDMFTGRRVNKMVRVLGDGMLPCMSASLLSR